MILLWALLSCHPKQTTSRNTDRATNKSQNDNKTQAPQFIQNLPTAYSLQAGTGDLGEKSIKTKVLIDSAHILQGTIQFLNADKKIQYNFCDPKAVCISGSASYSETKIEDFVTPSQIDESAFCYSLDKMKNVDPLKADLKSKISQFLLSGDSSGENLICMLANKSQYWSWIMTVPLK